MNLSAKVFTISGNLEELEGDMIESVEEDLVREVFQNTAGLPAKILPSCQDGPSPSSVGREYHRRKSQSLCD